jgi:hypothetical protein
MTEKNKLDLTPFLARGFGPEHDRIIANTPVRGIDRLLSYGKIRLAPETEEYLYGEYTPAETGYRPGSRPELEATARKILGDPPDAGWSGMRKLVSWVAANVVHPRDLEGETPLGRAISEEELIASGRGWCNEQARLVVALARTVGVHGRLVGLYCSDSSEGHMTAELRVDGKWGWLCATRDYVAELPDGSWASAAEIWHDPELRARLDAEWPLKSDYKGAMFGGVGIVNYPI